MRCTSSVFRTVVVLLSPVCILLSASPGFAVMMLSDGAVHDIAGASDQLEVADGPGNTPTTVNVNAGAVIGAGLTNFSVNARQHTVFTMSGGSLFDELFLFDNSSAHLTGGSIGDDLTPDGSATVVVDFVTVNDDVEANGASTVTINDGSFDEDIEANGTAKISIYGGMFQTGTDGAHVTASNASVINIHGGTFGVGHTDTVGGFFANGDAVINIYGGSISGQPQGLNASGNGVINVYGLGSQPASINTTGTGVINFREGGLQNLVAHGLGVQLSGTDGSLASIIAEDSSMITIYGTDFKFGSTPLSYGPLPFAAGNLSGVLADGTAITSVPFMRNFILGGTRGIIVLAAPVPEPNTVMLATLALAGLAVARKRKRS